MSTRPDGLLSSDAFSEEFEEIVVTTAPQRLRALLAEPGLVVMPAVWDGLTAKLTYGEGFKTAFLSGSCVAASRLGGPDLDLVWRPPLVLHLVGGGSYARRRGAGDVDLVS